MKTYYAPGATDKGKVQLYRTNPRSTRPKGGKPIWHTPFHVCTRPLRANLAPLLKLPFLSFPLFLKRTRNMKHGGMVTIVCLQSIVEVFPTHLLD